MTPTRQQASATRKIAGLTIINAMIFQEVLALEDGRVHTIRRTLDESDPISAFAVHWQFILKEIDYVPIFRIARELLLALPADPDLAAGVARLAETAFRIVEKRAAIRHDLMGRVYHRLLHEAKYLGTYYTSVPAATLLLKLTLPADHPTIDWATPESISNARVADLACGTGTLLMAAAEALTDNYVAACSSASVTPNLAKLHRCLIESVLHGYDVLASALHLTASTLALRSTSVSFDLTNLHCLPLGGRDHSLGSIELLHERRMQTTGDLFGAMPRAAAVTGRGDVTRATVEVPPLDICVMNPPFVRSVGGNLLFGSLSSSERRPMQAKLARYVRAEGVHANTTAGLGSVFIAVADRALKPDGQLGLVIPKALLSGIAWAKSRALLSESYEVRYLVASHDPARWNFSENTDLSEVLVVARKRPRRRGSAAVSVICINLWRNPTTPFEALSIAEQIRKGDIPDIDEEQGSKEIVVGNMRVGSAIGVSWDSIRDKSWLLPCAFAQSDLIRVANHLLTGRLTLPGSRHTQAVPLRRLGDIGTLGPDRRDIHDGFRLVQSRTPYAALWGHNSAEATSLRRTPNGYLEPRARPARGRPVRRAADLWPLAGRVAIVERLWLVTYRVVAVQLSEKVLSNVWWPLALRDDRQAVGRALVLWLNSTLGLLSLLASRVETRGAWIDFKKPILQELPVLDVAALTDAQLAKLDTAFERLALNELAPIPDLAIDPVRKQIDDALAAALGLPDVRALRQLLSDEPIVSLRAL
jgi:hypothetical protein